MQSYATMTATGQPSRAPVSAGRPVDDVSLAARGDRAALGRVLSGLAPHVLSTARRVLGARAARGHDAEDVTQETLLAIARVLPEMRDHQATLAYARRTAARRALRLRRDADRDIERLSGLVSERRGDLSRDVKAKHRADLLIGLLHELSEVQAETMVLRFALGLSLQEVADSMETSINTVRSRVRLAKEKLAEVVEAHPEIKSALEAP